MWQYSAKNRQNWCFFGINLPKRGIPPWANFYKIWLGESLSGSHPHAKFYRSGLIIVGLRPKTSPKMVIFCINLPQRGISDPLKWPHPYAKFCRCSFKNVALRPQKSPKMVIFGKYLPPWEKFWGSIKKLVYVHNYKPSSMQWHHNCFENYTASYRFRYHKLRHSKAWQKKQKKRTKNHTFSSTAGARLTIPTILGMVKEEVRPIFVPPNFFLIRSVLSPLGAIENLWENAPTAGKCL